METSGEDFVKLFNRILENAEAANRLGVQLTTNLDSYNIVIRWPSPLTDDNRVIKQELRSLVELELALYVIEKDRVHGNKTKVDEGQ